MNAEVNDQGFEKRSVNMNAENVVRFDESKVNDQDFVKIYKTLKFTDSDLVPLSEYNLKNKAPRDVFCFEIEDKLIGIPLYELAYHHLAQGKVDTKNFLLTFCPVCNSGMLLDPTVDGKTLNFRVGGVYKGAMIMADNETNSFWDPVTGECLGGKLKGQQLEILSSHQILTIDEARKEKKDMYLPKVTLSFWQRLVRRFQNGHTWRALPEGKFYPGFKASFILNDDRREEKEMGIGIWDGRKAKFYPLDSIISKETIEDEDFFDSKIIVNNNSVTKIPEVVFSNGKDTGYFVFTRWYSFAQTFPGCDIFED